MRSPEEELIILYDQFVVNFEKIIKESTQDV